MSKVLNVVEEEEITEILKRIYEKTECKYIFSKELVSRLSKIAYYGKSNIKTPKGNVQLYEFINEKSESLVMTFFSDVIKLNMNSGEEIEGYMLKHFATHQGQVINPNIESDHIVIMM